MTIKFFVPSVPVAQPRQRSRVAKIRGQLMAQNYTPIDSPVNAFKAATQMAAYAAYSGATLESDLDVSIVCLFPRPESRRKRGQGQEWYRGRMDADNLAKSVLDALNKKLYRDDRQVVRLVVEKRLAPEGEQPGAYITIECLT